MTRQPSWRALFRRSKPHAARSADHDCVELATSTGAPSRGWWNARGGWATSPNAARVGDYLSGGNQCLPADLAFAQALEEQAPDARAVCRAIRGFLGRAAVFSMQRGVRQFLILGEGLVTDEHPHAVARALDPTVRIAVIDSDPVTAALNHARLLPVPGSVAARADVTRPNRVLQAPDVEALLDLSQPIALFLGGALASMSDMDDPDGVLAGYRAGLSPGSHLVLWHASADNWPDVESAAKLWAERVGPAPLWTAQQMSACLSGLDLVAPGVVDATAWRPRRSTLRPGERLGVYAAVARL